MGGWLAEWRTVRQRLWRAAARSEAVSARSGVRPGSSALDLAPSGAVWSSLEAPERAQWDV